MSIVKKEYLNCIRDIIEPEDWVGPKPFRSAPFTLPDWFTKAKLPLKKIIRVLGATASIYIENSPDEEDPPKGLRLYSNLSKDFPSNEFIMMLNNYNCIKEFDITYLNINELDWYVIDSRFKPFPDVHGLHMPMVIEMELLLVNEKD
jgi:hypothetical protein